MFVEVEPSIQELYWDMGFEQILRDFRLTEVEVLQILQDTGYIDLDDYLGD